MQGEVDAEMCEDSEVEFNSGVECPGNRSIEPYVGSQLTIEEKEFTNCCILVEVAKDDLFAFKYKKQDRVFIGKCEWCSKRNVLPTICVCKRVRYCDDDCMKKDLRYH